MKIGQVAREAGVGVETVRFYERKGLLAEPQRRDSGYRQYGSDTVTLLRSIRRAKELGFSLREIRELLALRLDATATRAEVRLLANAKLSDIDGKIADLQRMRDSLSRLVGQCRGKGPVQGCPIITALDDKENAASKC